MLMELRKSALDLTFERRSSSSSMASVGHPRELGGCGGEFPDVHENTGAGRLFRRMQ